MTLMNTFSLLTCGGVGNANATLESDSLIRRSVTVSDSKKFSRRDRATNRFAVASSVNTAHDRKAVGAVPETDSCLIDGVGRFDRSVAISKE